MIDFDHSVRFKRGERSIIHGLGGRDDDAPEFTISERTKQFDHFKLNVELDNVTQHEIPNVLIFLCKILDYCLRRQRFD